MQCLCWSTVSRQSSGAAAVMNDPRKSIDPQKTAYFTLCDRIHQPNTLCQRFF